MVRKDEARRAVTAQAQPSGTASRAASAAALNLTQDQRDDINRTIMGSAEPGSMASINDLVGATLPESVEIQRMPSEVAQRAGELRDLGFVLIGDDVLIVDPRTRRVLDVIE